MNTTPAHIKELEWQAYDHGYTKGFREGVEKGRLNGLKEMDLAHSAATDTFNDYSYGTLAIIDATEKLFRLRKEYESQN